MGKIVVLFILMLTPLIAKALSDDYVALTDSTIEPVDVTVVTTHASVDMETHISAKQFILPAALMAYGTLEASLHNKPGILNQPIAREVIDHKPKEFHIDNYLQFVPGIAVYGLNLVGIKGKHNFKDRTIILGIASFYTAATVNGLKYTIKELRPDCSSKNSFPSGHTTVAFMGAEFMWQEFKDVSPWYGISGYIVATGVGALRIYNNRHWIGDVFFGAGLGMVCTKLAYITYSSLHKKFSPSSRTDVAKGLTFCPYFTGNQIGMSLSLQF